MVHPVLWWTMVDLINVGDKSLNYGFSLPTTLKNGVCDLSSFYLPVSRLGRGSGRNPFKPFVR